MSRERWLAISTVTVFALALAGAVYAAYVLVPPLVSDPRAKSTLLFSLIALVVAFTVIFLLFNRKRKG